jgi:glycerophosphoryl diester phosphodiesterase
MAHRGDSMHFPENSLHAFQDAVNLNVDVIETDIRVTKDDEIVFFHDARVNRTTDGKGFVRNKTLKELKQLDLGYRYKVKRDGKVTYPFRGKGLQILSLEEILTRYPKMKFNIDIKDRANKVPAILTHKLKDLNAENRTMVGSFHTKQLERMREISAVPTSAGPREIWHFRQSVRKWLKKHGLPKEDELSQLDVLDEYVQYFALQIPEKYWFLRVFRGPDFFAMSHKLNIAVHVWTVNRVEDMKRLLDWGADGLFSDDPKTLLRVVTERLTLEEFHIDIK